MINQHCSILRYDIEFQCSFQNPLLDKSCKMKIIMFFKKNLDIRVLHIVIVLETYFQTDWIIGR